MSEIERAINGMWRTFWLRVYEPAANGSNDADELLDVVEASFRYDLAKEPDGLERGDTRSDNLSIRPINLISPCCEGGELRTSFVILKQGSPPVFGWTSSVLRS